MLQTLVVGLLGTVERVKTQTVNMVVCERHGSVVVGVRGSITELGGWIFQGVATRTNGIVGSGSSLGISDGLYGRYRPNDSFTVITVDPSIESNSFTTQTGIGCGEYQLLLRRLGDNGELNLPPGYMEGDLIEGTYTVEGTFASLGIPNGTTSSLEWDSQKIFFKTDQENCLDVPACSPSSAPSSLPSGMPTSPGQCSGARANRQQLAAEQV